MKLLNKFYNYYLKWRPAFYRKKWIIFKYLSNYNECNESKHGSYRFRNGYNIYFREQSSAEHIFSEIFVGECYPLTINKNDKKVIIDIGANIGFFTIYSLLKYPKAKIYAVEASPNNFKILQKNINENSLEDKVKIYNNIVSSSQGILPFYISPNSGWSSIYNTRGAKNGELIHLETLSISQLFSFNNIVTVDLMKIDIEGAEYDILLNDNFLENYNVKELYIEVDKKPRDERYSYSQLINYLQKYYEKLTIYNSESAYPLIHCRNQSGTIKYNKYVE